MPQLSLNAFTLPASNFSDFVTFGIKKETMAKRIAPLQDNTPDYLIKPKKEFESDLEKRIAIGKELLDRQIINPPTYSKLHTDYHFWHDFNAEFLKRAFNKTNSQYYQDYTKTPGIYVSSMTPPTLSEQIDDLRGDVSNHLMRLKKIKEKLVLIDELPDLEVVSKEPKQNGQLDGLIFLGKLFSKFHRTVQSLRHRHADRDTLIIKDEYDVQDLLRGLLQIHFEDVREEDYSPSYAGGNSRIDFVIKNEKIVIETKMTNDNLKDKDIGSQLLIDIGRYRAHPDCEVLVVFIYDKADHIRNKTGIINDLERMSSPTLEIKVFIEPK